MLLMIHNSRYAHAQSKVRGNELLKDIHADDRNRRIVCSGFLASLVLLQFRAQCILAGLEMLCFHSLEVLCTDRLPPTYHTRKSQR